MEDKWILVWERGSSSYVNNIDIAMMKKGGRKVVVKKMLSGEGR